MKKFVKIIMLGLFAAMLYGDVQAQQKKHKKSASSKKSTVKKFTPKEFGTFTSVSDLRDEADSTREYASVKNLMENNGVTLAYADSTFQPKEPLRRGDFVVSLNSALEAIKKSADKNGLDSSTSVISTVTPGTTTPAAPTPSTTPGTTTPATTTPESAQSEVASVSDIKDLQENSIYYPATQSLIEKWHFVPVTKNKLLNAGEVMTEAEVYDVLKTTLGYTSPGTNPYSKAMTRGKFAMILNNAVNQKLSEVNAMSTARTESLDSVRRQQELTLKQQEKQKVDSLAKEAELSKIEAQKKESETWTKLSEREKRKQIRSSLKNQK